MLQGRVILQRLCLQTRLLSTISCSKCGEYLSQSHIICPKCNAIRRINPSTNFFELLNVEKAYKIDLQKLQKEFRHLQTLVHPDKFSNKPKDEQSISADWSSLINKAYTTLQDPIKRGEYLLQEQNIKIPEKNESVDPEFLMEVMEKNEEVAELKNRSEIEKYLEELRKEIENLHLSLGESLSKQDFKEALNLLIRMRYFHNLETKLKEKLYEMSP